MGLTASVYDHTYTTLVQDLTLADDVQAQPSLSGAGAGGLTLPLTDPADPSSLAAEQAACAYRNIVRIEDEGDPVFAFVVRSKTVKSVSAQEEAGQGIEYDGPGTLSLWSKAVLYPELALGEPPYSDTRLFNFASRLLDDSSWGAAVEGEQGTGDVGGPRAGFPVNLPPQAEEAYWIWSEADDVNGSVPAGDAYFRRWYTSPGELVRIFITADNSHEFYLDDALVEIDSLAISGGVGWAGLKQVDRWLSPGDHLFAIKGNNAPGVDPNPAGVFMAMVEMADKGSVLGGTPLLVTDSSWSALGYPAAPPGFTPGHQVRLFLEEAQDRGALDGWTLGCTDSLDSDGVAWPSAPESSYQIGLDGLAFIEQLAEVYVDVMADFSALELNLWSKDTLGGPSGVTLTPGVNVLSMVNSGAG